MADEMIDQYKKYADTMRMGLEEIVRLRILVRRLKAKNRKLKEELINKNWDNFQDFA